MQNFPRFLLHFFELQLAVSEVKLKHGSKTGFHFPLKKLRTVITQR